MGLALAGGAAAQPFAVRWNAEANPPFVEVEGMAAADLAKLGQRELNDAEWAARLAVFAEQGSGKAIPPMVGTWRVAGSRLRFEPRFPLQRGVRYRAEFIPPGAAPVVAYFQLPPDTAPPTTVVRQIYPSAAALPENQLKFYVHFSAPMTRGAAYQHIRIRGDAGGVIELPFLELDEELWDPAMMRLTLLIDPGRIKRGVKPLEDIGPVFETGKRYAITVDAAWRDAAGRVLREPFEKKFRIGPADRTPPDPARWKIRAPVANTRNALVVDFDEPMDHALTLRLLDVVRLPEGSVLIGDETIGAEERQWTFRPDEPWRIGAYELKIATTIEDLAGNNIGKTFDVDLFEDVQRRIETRSVSVQFEVK